MAKFYKKNTKEILEQLPTNNPTWFKMAFCGLTPRFYMYLGQKDIHISVPA
jgi:hypothetical protein